MKVIVIKGHYDYEGFEIVKVFGDIDDARDWLKVEQDKLDGDRKAHSLGYDSIEFDEYKVY